MPSGTRPRVARGAHRQFRGDPRSIPRKKIRYAVVGLGHIAQVAVLPAFSHARRNSALAALVSDSPDKLKKLGRRYGVEKLYRYADIDDLSRSGDIDAVYLALPNSMHEDFTIRAARAGLHVLCEKPMAMTTAGCKRMIECARDHRVKLMVAYRLHFERGNLAATEIARSGKLGDLRFFSSQFSMQVRRGNLRLSAAAGGGPLYDIGIYCMNAARAVFAAEPTEVLAATATHSDPRFNEVPETVAALLKFPQQRLASFTCSFGAADRSVYEIVGTKGSITLDPAYEYGDGVEYELRIGGRTRYRRFAHSDQFAPELLYFSDCILRNRDPEPSGEEGMADVRVIEALNQSIRTGKCVPLSPMSRRRLPTMQQEIRRRNVRPPQLVRVQPAAL